MAISDHLGVDDPRNARLRIPGRVGDAWRVRIDLAVGRIVGWPSGMTAAIHYKVCDAGKYFLLDAAGNRLAEYGSHYVPGDFLCHGDEGYGDYIIMKVDGEGLIQHYRRPDVLPDRWKPL
jgi:hypothetical protein